MNFDKISVFLRDRLYSPLIKILKQGITPHKLALTVAFGVGLGLFPIVGFTTILCIVVAFALGLNQAAIQIVNYFVYPIQLLLIVPFVKVGQYIFKSNPLPYSFTEITEMLRYDTISAMKKLWFALLLGIGGWAVFALPTVLVVYFLILPAFKKVVRGKGEN